MSNLIEPFLERYQTENVMIPYLCDDLCTLLKKLLKRIKKIDMNMTALDLLALDLDGEFETSKVEIGFIADNILKQKLSQKKISERDVLQFKMEARAFIKAIIKKLVKKCPIKYKIVRQLPCLAPHVIVQNTTDADSLFKGLLECLVEAQRIESTDVDQLLEDYSEWSTSVRTESAFIQCVKYETKLDSLYYNFFPKSKYPQLWEIIKNMLLLSHGQASVERGFSLGKAIAKDNQLPETIMNMRVVKDHIVSVGGLDNVAVTKEMLTFVSSSHKRYMMSLESKKEEESKKKSGMKRKIISEKIDDLKSKTMCLSQQVSGLNSEALNLFEKAEVTNKMQFVVQANALLKRKKEKETEVGVLEKEISQKQNDLSNIM